MTDISTRMAKKIEDRIGFFPHGECEKCKYLESRCAGQERTIKTLPCELPDDLAEVKPKVVKPPVWIPNEDDIPGVLRGKLRFSKHVTSCDDYS